MIKRLFLCACGDVKAYRVQFSDSKYSVLSTFCAAAGIAWPLNTSPKRKSASECITASYRILTHLRFVVFSTTYVDRFASLPVRN